MAPQASTPQGGACSGRKLQYVSLTLGRCCNVRVCGFKDLTLSALHRHSEVQPQEPRHPSRHSCRRAGAAPASKGRYAAGHATGDAAACPHLHAPILGDALRCFARQWAASSAKIGLKRMASFATGAISPVETASRGSSYRAALQKACRSAESLNAALERYSCSLDRFNSNMRKVKALRIISLAGLELPCVRRDCATPRQRATLIAHSFVLTCVQIFV